jgi:predicted N-acetyltransferase YhbS
MSAKIHDIVQLINKTAHQSEHFSGWEPRRIYGFAFYRDDKTLSIAEDFINAHWLELRDVNNAIQAALVCETPGDYFLIYNSTAVNDLREFLEESKPASLNVAEQELELIELLKTLGFQKTEQTALLMAQSVIRHQVELPAGYQIRSMSNTKEDHESIAEMLNVSFSRDFHNEAEYRNFQRFNPLYNPELDLIMTDNNGEMIANVAFTIFANNKYAILEPAATHPAHQGKGVSRALIHEGVNRLFYLGVEDVLVQPWPGNKKAVASYEAAGFSTYDIQYRWTASS